MECASAQHLIALPGQWSCNSWLVRQRGYPIADRVVHYLDALQQLFHDSKKIKCQSQISKKPQDFIVIYTCMLFGNDSQVSDKAIASQNDQRYVLVPQVLR